MQLRKWFLLFVVILTISSCGAGDSYIAGDEINFRTIDQGDYSGYGKSGHSHSEPVLFAIRTEDDFESFWADHTSIFFAPVQEPEVDFAAEIVLVLMDMIEPSGGYYVEITAVEEYPGYIKVSATRNTPGSNCVLPAVITQPYHIVAIPASEKTVSLVLHTEVIDCI